MGRLRVLAGMVVLAMAVFGLQGAPAAAERWDPERDGYSEVWEPPAQLNTTAVGQRAREVPVATEGRGPEAAELRTRTSKTFVSDSGMRDTVISAGSLHYQDAAGVWQDIDDRLVADTIGWRNRANRYRVQFPETLADPVRISAPGGVLGFSVLGADPVPGQVSANRVDYPAALEGATVRFVALPDGVKEFVVLDGPEAPDSYRYLLQAGRGLTVELADDGGLLVTNQAGELVWRVAAPVMEDAAGERSSAFDVALEQSPDGVLFTVQADRGWLGDPLRAWPVLVDPTTTLTSEGDCTIASGAHSGTISCALDTLEVGQGADTTLRRALLGFDLQDALRPMASGGPVQVAAAEVGLYHTGGVVKPIDVHAVTSGWDAHAATWDHRDAAGSVAWDTAGGDFEADPVLGATTGVSGNGSWSAEPGWVYWYATAAAQRWFDGGLDEHGLLLKAADEMLPGVVSFAGSDHADPALRPQIRVMWETGVGERPYWSYEQFQLNPQVGMHGLDLRVNLANRNLIIAANEGRTDGVAGHDMLYWRVYNNLATEQRDYGRRWSGTASSQQLHTFGHHERIVYDEPSGGRIAFIDANGDGNYEPTTRFDADLTRDAATGTYQLTEHHSGTVWHFASNRRLDRVEDRSGNAITYFYDTDGRVESIQDTRGGVTTVGYNADGQVETIADPGGRVRAYTYDNEFMTSAEPRDGYATTFDDNGYKRPQRIVDANGNVTEFTYAPSSATHDWPLHTIKRYLNVDTGDALMWTFETYDDCTVADPGNDPDRCTVMINPRADKTTYYTDPSGRVTKVVDALGRERETGYTATGDIDTMTAPMGGGVELGYDTATGNNVRSITQATSATESITALFDYDDPNNPFAPSRYENTQGGELGYTYDSLGRLETVTDGDAGPVLVGLTYNADGTVATVTDARGKVTSYGYDSLARLTSITPPAPLGAVTIGYDALHRLRRVTDGNGQTLEYRHDALDKLTRIELPDTSEIRYGYTLIGQLRSLTDHTGVTRWSYNRLGWLRYDELPDATEIRYGYNGAGLISSYTGPDGYVDYDTDAAGQYWRIRDPDGSATLYTHDDDGNVTQIAYPNGVTVDHDHDLAGRVTRITAVNATATLVDLEYSYADPDTGDQTGLRRTVTDHLAGTVTRYDYDHRDRLASAVTRDGSNAVVSEYHYDYDAVGNRTLATVGGTTTTYTYNDADQVTSDSDGVTYSHDNAGNLTADSTGRSFDYNELNQTTQVTPAGGSPVEFDYRNDTQARRIQAGATTFVDSSLGVLAETDGTTDTGYLRGPGGTLHAHATSTDTFYPITDALGSVLALTDGTGAAVNTYRYGPYGEPEHVSETVANPHQWVGAHGYYKDGSTGLYHVGHRYYDPTLARWTQRDPLDGRINLLNPGEESPYVYAGCDPINAIDPTGLCTARFWIEAAVFGVILVSLALALLNPTTTVVAAALAVGLSAYAAARLGELYWRECVG